MSNGVSTDFYRHCEFFPIFGSGQGNGASAPIWLVVSVFLMITFRQRHKGMFFVSPDQTLSTSSCLIDGIVDDTMIETNSPEEGKTLAQTIQVMAQDWSDLLWMSGGNLELRKCLFYSIQWKSQCLFNPCVLCHEASSIEWSRTNLF